MGWGINTQLINEIVINLYVDYVINSDLNGNHKVIRQKNPLRNHFESRWMQYLVMLILIAYHTQKSPCSGFAYVTAVNLVRS